MIKSQVGFQPHENNSRVALSEHQYVIIYKSGFYPEGHVCIVRKELKNTQKQAISWEMKKILFFSLKIIVYTSKFWKHIILEICYKHLSFGIQIRCSTTPTEHLELYRWSQWEINSVQWSSFQHWHVQTGTGMQTWTETCTHIHTDWPLFPLECVLRLSAGKLSLMEAFWYLPKCKVPR